MESVDKDRVNQIIYEASKVIFISFASVINIIDDDGI